MKTSETMNADLNRIKEWSFQWKMSFNPDPNKQVAEVIVSHKLKPPAHPALSFNNFDLVKSHFRKTNTFKSGPQTLKINRFIGRR